MITSNTAHVPEILAQVQRYFDGLYHSDTRVLRTVFHPDALYACATNGQLLHYSMPEYFAVVDQRLSPASQGHARSDEVLSVEWIGAHTVVTRLRCCILPKHFEDVLCWIYVEGRWQIISKVFEYTT